MPSSLLCGSLSPESLERLIAGLCCMLVSSATRIEWSTIVVVAHVIQPKIPSRNSTAHFANKVRDRIRPTSLRTLPIRRDQYSFACLYTARALANESKRNPKGRFKVLAAALMLSHCSDRTVLKLCNYPTW